MASKEVVKKEEGGALATLNYGEMSGVGFEDTKGSDLSIPFINLLQSNSPEVEEERVPGARQGDMINTVTGELIKAEKGFVFLPVYKEEAWVEWIPRVKGGGFVGIHDPAGELIQDLIKQNGGSRIPPKGSDGKRISFKNGDNEVIETYYVYGLLLNDEGNSVESFAVISFSSTKIKPYRDWLTSMYLIKGKPPMFANRVRFKSIKQKNESGSYANFSISPFGETWASSLIHPVEEKKLLEEAVSFRDMVINGIARADFSQQSSVVGVDSEKAPF